MNTFERNAYQLSPDKPAEMLASTLATAQNMSATIMRGQAEAMSFWSRRAQAWMALPVALSNCKSPQDLAAAQQTFVETMTRDWTDGSRRCFELWMGAFGNAPESTLFRWAEDAKASEAAPQPGNGTSTSSPYEWWRTDVKAILPRRHETYPNGAAHGRG